MRMLKWKLLAYEHQVYTIIYISQNQKTGELQGCLTRMLDKAAWS